MPEQFDPYLKWLGIRDPGRPPDHYVLLGITRLEADREVIEHAADRQMAHLRSLAAGPQAVLTQRLLNEISAARVCLLNAESKAKYDAALRAKIAALAPRPPQAAAAARPAARTLAAPSSGIEFAARSRPTKRRPSLLPVWATGGAVLLLVIVAAAIYLTSRPAVVAVNPVRPAPPAAPVTPTQPPEEATPEASAEVPEPDEAEPVTPEEPPATPEPEPEAMPEAPADQPVAETPTPAPAEPVPPETPPEPTPTEPAKEPASTLLPAPDAEALKAARKDLQDVLADELRGATQPDTQLALAQTLLTQAANTENDPAQAYVLWETARGLAHKALSPTVALQADDELAARYQVDGLNLAVESLTEIAKQTKDPKAVLTFLDVAMLIVNDAVRTDRYDDATTVLKAAATAARNSRDANLRAQVGDLSSELQKLIKEWRTAERALAALAADPTDAKANLAAGKFYCLQKEDWDKGLPLLSQGSDAKLADLAHRDLAKPTAADGQFSLAEDWWDAAKVTGPWAVSVQRRATFWYQAALPQLAGVRQAKAESRLTGPDAVELFLAEIEPVKKKLWEEVNYPLRGRPLEPVEQEGVEFLHSLLVIPFNNDDCRVLYKIPKGYNRLSAAVSLNKHLVSGTPLVFQVLADGQELWVSPPILSAKDRVRFDVALPKVQSLELVVLCNGPQSWGHAIWLEPRLIRGTPLAWLRQSFGSGVRVATRDETGTALRAQAPSK